MSSDQALVLCVSIGSLAAIVCAWLFSESMVKCVTERMSEEGWKRHHAEEELKVKHAHQICMQTLQHQQEREMMQLKAENESRLQKEIDERAEAMRGVAVQRVC